MMGAHREKKEREEEEKTQQKNGGFQSPKRIRFQKEQCKINAYRS